MAAPPVSWRKLCYFPQHDGVAGGDKRAARGRGKSWTVTERMSFTTQIRSDISPRSFQLREQCILKFRSVGKKTKLGSRRLIYNINNALQRRTSLCTTFSWQIYLGKHFLLIKNKGLENKKKLLSYFHTFCFS